MRSCPPSRDVSFLISPFTSFMPQALAEARAAALRGEVPVGAVVVHKNVVIASAGNRTLELADPTAHAEMLAIRMASQHLGSERLTTCDLYVTLEPCAMCAGAIANARLKRLYYGADDVKSGGVAHGARVFAHTTCHHKPDIIAGLESEASAHLLQTFFSLRR